MENEKQFCVITRCLVSLSVILVVCPSFTLLMMMLLPGWPTMGLYLIRKKKKSYWYLMAT